MKIVISILDVIQSSSMFSSDKQVRALSNKLEKLEMENEALNSALEKTSLTAKTLHDALVKVRTDYREKRVKDIPTPLLFPPVDL